MKIGAVRLAALAGYAALGPITGPLAAGVVRSLRNGEAALAALYLVAIPISYVGLVSAASVMLPAAARAADSVPHAASGPAWAPDGSGAVSANPQ